MALMDVVKWNANNQLLAWKYPSQELATHSQLIVSESQEAVLLLGGEMAGPFGPGRHVLDTQNVPLLTSLLKIPYGGQSPYTAEVWFVQKTTPLDLRWGTPDAIQVLDPKFNILLPVRAFGQFGIQIDNTKMFLLKFVGTMPSFSRDHLTSYFRGITITRVKSLIGAIIIQSKITVLETAAMLDDISAQLQQRLETEFAEFGVRLINFTVNSINVPEDDPAVVGLRNSLSKRADMGILGYNYAQERSFDVLESAAGNPGSTAGAFAGAGIGLGMGAGLGNAIGNNFGSLAGVMNPAGAAPAPTISCPQCNAALTEGVQFCSNCGTKLHRCAKCRKPMAEAGDFCVACQSSMVSCPQCRTVNPAATKFCSECGAALQKSCCGKSLPGNTKFCPECGRKLN